MSKSLTGCLKKAGKNITPGDAKLVKDIQTENFMFGNAPDATAASISAVDEVSGMLTEQRQNIVDTVKRKGGNTALYERDGESLMRSDAGDARIMRARDQGFDTDTTWYHGSKNVIDPAVGLKPKYSDGLVFLTSNPAFASDWILGTGGIRTRSVGPKGGAEDIAAAKKRLDEEIDWDRWAASSDAEMSGFGDKGAYYKAMNEKRNALYNIERQIDGSVYPLFTSVKNTFDPRKDYKKIEQFLLDSPKAEERGMHKLVEQGKHKGGHWAIYENKYVVDELKRMGYDSMMVKEDPFDDAPHETLAVFDPAHVRSKFSEFKSEDAGKTLLSMSKEDIGSVRTAKEGFNAKVLRKNSNASYSSLSPETREVVDSVLDTMERPGITRKLLDEYADTPWAQQAIEGALIQAAIVDLMAGKNPRHTSQFDNDAITIAWREGIKKDGVNFVLEKMRTGKVLSHPAKPVYAVNGSYIACEPTRGCASFCYACKGRDYPFIHIKAELSDYLARNRPKEYAKLVANEYSRTPEHKAGGSLRLFEHGDLQPEWIPFINELTNLGVMTRIDEWAVRDLKTNKIVKGGVGKGVFKRDAVNMAQHMKNKKTFAITDALIASDMSFFNDPKGAKRRKKRLKQLQRMNPNQIRRELIAAFGTARGYDLTLFEPRYAAEMTPKNTHYDKETMVRVHLFSKKPHLLRQIDPRNVRLLSIDNSSHELAEANMDLPIAYVYQEFTDMQWVEEFRKKGGNVQLILPVINGGKHLTEDQINAIPKDLKPKVCPVDDGRAKGVGILPGEWNCVRCDAGGGIGCYHGQTAKQLELRAGKLLIDQPLNKIVTSEEDVTRIREDLEDVISKLEPNEQAIVREELSNVLRAARTGFDIEREVETDKGLWSGLTPNEAGFIEAGQEGEITPWLDEAGFMSEDPIIGEIHPDNDPLRFQMEDDVVGDMVNQNPDQPLSQLFKYGAVLQSIGDKNNNLPPFREGITKAKDMGENAIEKFLNLIHRDYLPDYMPGDRMPSLKRYVKAAKHMDGRRNHLMQQTEVTIGKWYEMVRKNPARGALVGEVMHAATMAGVVLDKPYKPLKSGELSDADRKMDTLRRRNYEKLKEYYDSEKMGDEGRAIYLEVREAYGKRRDTVIDALEKRINTSTADGKTKDAMIHELREKFEAGRVAGDYFPLQRFGNHWSVAKDADGNIIAFSKHERASHMRTWVSEFRKAGYTANGGRIKNDIDIMHQVDPAFTANITEKILEMRDKEGNRIPNAQALADDVWQLYLRSLPELSIRKAFIHRKNRIGFTADAMRAFGHHMFHGAHQIARLEHVPIMEQYMRDMSAEADVVEQSGDPDAHWAVPVYNQMVRRHEWALNPKGSKEAAQMTSLGFAMYLGVSPGAALVNLSQTPLIAFPTMVSKFGVTKSGTVAAQLLKASGEYLGTRASMDKKLTGDELRAWEDANKTGLFDKTLAHDLAGVSEDGMDYSVKMRRAANTVSWMFHKAEELNRQMTYMASYRLARDKFGNAADAHEKSMDLAAEIVWMSHYDYGNPNRPPVLQNDFAKVIFLFKQFGINTAYRLARDFRDGVLRNPNLSAEAKNEAAVRFGGILGMTGLLAGVTSEPLWWAFEAITNAILGDDDDPYDMENALWGHLTDTIGEEAANIVMKGVWDTMTGMSLSSRISLNDLAFRDVPEERKGLELAEHYLKEIMGPVVSLPIDFMRGMENMEDGHVDRGLEKIMPKFITDYMKAWRYAKEGALNFRDQPIMKPEEFTNKELAITSLGVTPFRLAKMYELNRSVNTRKNLLDDRYQLLMDRLFMSVRNKDPEAQAEYTKALVTFAKKNPTYQITARNVIQSAMTRNRYDQMTVGGVFLDKRHLYLREKMRIFEKEEQ